EFRRVLFRSHRELLPDDAGAAAGAWVLQVDAPRVAAAERELWLADDQLRLAVAGDVGDGRNAAAVVAVRQAGVVVVEGAADTGVAAHEAVGVRVGVVRRRDGDVGATIAVHVADARDARAQLRRGVTGDAPERVAVEARHDARVTRTRTA